MSNNVPWTSKPSRGVLTLFWLSTENKVHVAHESEVTTNFVRKRHEKEQHAFFKSQVHGRSSVMVVKEAIFKSETSRDQCQCCHFFFFLSYLPINSTKALLEPYQGLSCSQTFLLRLLWSNTVPGFWHFCSIICNALSKAIPFYS